MAETWACIAEWSVYRCVNVEQESSLFFLKHFCYTKKILEIGVASAVINYNYGLRGFNKLFAALGIPPGYYGLWILAERFYVSEKYVQKVFTRTETGKKKDQRHVERSKLTRKTKKKRGESCIREILIVSKHFKLCVLFSQNSDFRFPQKQNIDISRTRQPIVFKF